MRASGTPSAPESSRLAGTCRIGLEPCSAMIRLPRFSSRLAIAATSCLSGQGPRGSRIRREQGLSSVWSIGGLEYGVWTYDPTPDRALRSGPLFVCGGPLRRKAPPDVRRGSS